MGGFKSYALKELVESSGVSYRQNSISFIFRCPRCRKKDKLYIRKNDGRFVCWVCAESSSFKGRAEFALSELLEKSLSEIKESLYEGVVPVDAHLEIKLLDFGSHEEMEEVYLSVPWPIDYYPIAHPHSSRGLEYLQGRGIGLALAEKYNLRYCPRERRVVFPIESEGVLLGWQARSILPGTVYNEEGEAFTVPKAITSKSLSKGKHLMFQDQLVDSPHAVICEGPIDAIKADLCGGNVATLGKAVSKEQVDIIKQSGVQKVYIALDPDAGIEALKLRDAFSGLEIYRLLPEDGYEDLGAMSPDQVYRQFLKAERFDNTGRLFLFLKSRD